MTLEQLEPIHGVIAVALAICAGLLVWIIHRRRATPEEVKRIRRHVRRRDFRRAGELELRRGHIQQAYDLFDRGDVHDLAADCAEKLGHLDWAATHAEQAGLTERAADLYFKVGDYRAAARLFERLGRFNRAAEALAASHRAPHRDLARLWENAYLDAVPSEGEGLRKAELDALQRFATQTGKAYEAMGDLSRAAHFFELGGEREQARQLRRQVPADEMAQLDVARNRILERVRLALKTSVGRGGSEAVLDSGLVPALKDIEAVLAAVDAAASGEPAATAVPDAAASPSLALAGLGPPASDARREPSGPRRATPRSDSHPAATPTAPPSAARSPSPQRVAQPLAGSRAIERTPTRPGTPTAKATVASDPRAEPQVFARPPDEPPEPTESRERAASPKPGPADSLLGAALGEVRDEVRRTQSGGHREVTPHSTAAVASARRTSGSWAPIPSGVGSVADPAGQGTAEVRTRQRRYRLLEEAGRGGTAIVYRAFDGILKCEVALKFLPSLVAASQSLAELFDTLLTQVEQLEHPNIVTVHDHGVFDGQPYVAMEWVEGHSVASLLREDGRDELPPLDVLAIAEATLSALKYAHTRGVLHLDVQPSNLLRGPMGIQVKDFSLARLADPAHTTDLSAEPAFLASEQLAGAEPDRRTDLFGVGATLYRLISGKRPFEGMRRDRQPESLARLTPGIPSRLSNLVHQCLHPDPSHRPNSVEPLLEAVGAMRHQIEAFAERSGWGTREIGADERTTDALRELKPLPEDVRSLIKEWLKEG